MVLSLSIIYILAWVIFYALLMLALYVDHLLIRSYLVKGYTHKWLMWIIAVVFNVVSPLILGLCVIAQPDRRPSYISTYDMPDGRVITAVERSEPQVETGYKIIAIVIGVIFGLIVISNIITLVQLADVINASSPASQYSSGYYV